MLKEIVERRSIRSFTSELPTHEELSKVVEAAGWAPSGMNNQSWHFMMLTGNALEYLRVVVRDYFRVMEITEKTPPYLCKCKEWSRKDDFSFFYHAPAMLVISNQVDYRNVLIDSAAAAENALLEATHLGLGSCWIGALTWIYDAPPIKEALSKLGVPDNYRACFSIALGYPVKTHPADPRKYQSTWVNDVPSDD